ncbi:MAG: Rieske family ferredoxin [Magnetovibrio sp.]|nr:Rieske family ferredoxin [Magnetovibrio sp.]
MIKADEWHLVASTEDIDEEDVIQVRLDDLLLAIYNLDGEFYATSDICTHENTCLSEGIVVGDIIECPRHQGRFHIPTGEPKGAPASVPIPTYPVKVIDNKIYVAVGDSSEWNN